MSSLTYTDQEIHQLGMNYIGETLQEMGYEFFGVNSNLKKHPQFVCYKKSKKLVYVAVKTVLYPDNPNKQDEALLKRLKEHADKQDAHLWFAGVGLAHAYNINERLTKEDDFLVKFDGFKEI